MSRNIPDPAVLPLTEQLDNLEQSITLTLQEIDYNFSRAHATLTTRILPIVEKYANHSNAVWDGSKFWKQFFEASANVSLSGVEEPDEAVENPITNQFLENSDKNEDDSSSESDEDTGVLEKDEESKFQAEDYDSSLENADITESTPRVPRSNHKHGSDLNDSRSLSELMLKSIKYPLDGGEVDEPSLPVTPDHTFSMAVASSAKSEISPYKPISKSQNTTLKIPGLDPLLHRVLDKNYRLQATPLIARKDKKESSNKPSWRDLSSPLSSPPAAAPRLHADLFSSPTRPRNAANILARTPGISVQTPLKNRPETKSSNLLLREEISWKSDSEEDAEGVYNELGMSPPKTIQFNLSQSKLLQTPAREASQKIVQDLLTTAGLRFDTSDTDDSLSMVIRNEIYDDF